MRSRLGPMGFALAKTLHSHGHPTTVWNRTPERADGLVAAGVRRAATVAEAVSASPATIMCLKDYETMCEVFGSAGDALRGRVLVNLNSGTPEEARAVAEWAAERACPTWTVRSWCPRPWSDNPDPSSSTAVPGRFSTSTGDAARAIADGHGGKSYLAVFEVFKKAAS
ncbi:NAD(P)-binding domain-containing protein [Amycolatopsis thermoflava]|uniref:NAD(P)-binding domain-containing protein n=1 Tax=Amycolatopsis thermoflava TaxID=84480 RepID=UPI003667F8C7